MKNTDEPSLRSAALALVVMAAIVAALLIPSPPAEVPVIELEPSSAETEPVLEAEAATVARPPNATKSVLYAAMRPVCACESVNDPDAAPEHYEADGVTVRRGRVNPADIGMCQIHEPVWGETARELGYDIYTPEGNARMANWIYDHEGYFPWRYSKGCHGLS